MKFENLQNLRFFLDAIPNIHQGGCGIAALCMLRFLKEKGHKQAKAIFLYSKYNDERYVFNNKSLTSQSSLIVPMNHVGIVHKGHIIDCNRSIEPNEFRHIHLVEDATLVNVLHCNNWNSDFDRETHLPIIIDKTGINLMDINAKAPQVTLDEVLPHYVYKNNFK